MNTQRIIKLVAMILGTVVTLVLLDAPAAHAAINRHSCWWKLPFGPFVEAWHYLHKDGDVTLPNSWSAPMERGGKHHFSNIDRVMLNGVQMVDGVLYPVVVEHGEWIVDTSFVLSKNVGIDEYGNYVVEIRQDIGRYPTVVIPQITQGRILVPVFIWAENDAFTEVYLYLPERPRRGDPPGTRPQHNAKVATWQVPPCWGRIVLLDANGEYDVRYQRSGGANTPYLLPAAGTRADYQSPTKTPVALAIGLPHSMGFPCNCIGPVTASTRTARMP